MVTCDIVTSQGCFPSTRSDEQQVRPPVFLTQKLHQRVHVAASFGENKKITRVCFVETAMESSADESGRTAQADVVQVVRALVMEVSSPQRAWRISPSFF